MRKQTRWPQQQPSQTARAPWRWIRTQKRCTFYTGRRGWNGMHGSRRTCCKERRSSKKQALQSIAVAFPGNAVLHKWRIVPSPACTLCGHPAETQSNIQCLCPELKGPRIRAHHNIAKRLWQGIRAAAKGYQCSNPAEAARRLGCKLDKKCLLIIMMEFRVRRPNDRCTTTVACLLLLPWPLLPLPPLPLRRLRT
jgi:hypothetical protein